MTKTSRETGEASLIDRLAQSGAYRAHWARLWLTAGQHRAAWAVIISLCLAAAIWPLWVAGSLIALMTGVQLLHVLFRALLFGVGWLPSATTITRRPDDALPTYTIIVPMYEEAAVVPELIDALGSLNYPPDKLDVLIALEQDDRATWSALAALDLPDWVRLIRVPDGQPRTKPRACNVALAHARGSFVVVYDAEDRPEPEQLRDALAAFDQHGPRVACLQAKLIPYNAYDTFTTRMFALDYCQWFDATLMGLQRLGLPIPLGGTSNHFRAEALNDCGAWDPYNVTEDADLGLRAARLGYETRILDSTTFEEAPVRAKDWFSQRARWVQGYIQTLLVHFRSAASLGLPPLTFMQRLGIGLFIAASVFFALVNPLLWAVCLAFLLWPDALWQLPFADELSTFALVGWIGGNGLIVLLAIVAPLRRPGLRRLSPWGLATPIFWLMVSAAAWRGAWQFLRAPFHWNKTRHGLAPLRWGFGRLAWRSAVGLGAAMALTAEAEAGAWSQPEGHGLSINQAGVGFGETQRLLFDGHTEVGLGYDLTVVVAFDGDIDRETSQHVGRAGAGLRYSFKIDALPSWQFSVEPSLRYQWHQSPIPDPVFAGDGIGYALRLDAGRSFELFDLVAFANIGASYVVRSLAPEEYKLELVAGIDLDQDWQVGVGYFGAISPGTFAIPGAYAKDEAQVYLRYRVDADYSVSVSIMQTLAAERTEPETAFRISLWTHIYPAGDE